MGRSQARGHLARLTRPRKVSRRAVSSTRPATGLYRDPKAILSKAASLGSGHELIQGRLSGPA
jgi:hypothetical protein